MENYLAFIVSIIVLIFMLLLFRGIILWYAKINERIYLLERNNKLLSKLVEHFTGEESEELKNKNVKKGIFINKEEK